MAQTPTTSGFSDIMNTLQTGAHAIAAAGTERFDHVAIFSLACYLIFAIVALHYALKPWAEKAMLASIVSATAASLLLHLSLRHSPSYTGEGALWKFIILSQYLPWGVIGLGCIYLLYRGLRRLQIRRH